MIGVLILQSVPCCLPNSWAGSLRLANRQIPLIPCVLGFPAVLSEPLLLFIDQTLDRAGYAPDRFHGITLVNKGHLLVLADSLLLLIDLDLLMKKAFNGLYVDIFRAPW
jgi:hypothetical protein